MLISLATAGAAAADPKPNFDSRGATRIPAFSKGEKAAQADLSGDLGGDALVGRVTASRSAVAVTGLKDQLTDPSRDDPEQIALAYLRDNAVSFGLRADDIDALKLQDRYTSWEGTTHLIWVQSAGGVDAYDNKVGANVARDGSVINTWSTAIPDFAGDGTPAISAGDALGIAARDVDAPGAAPRAGAPTGPDKATKFSNDATATLTLFGTPGGAKLAWKVGLAGPAPDTYQVVVDAATGTVLARQDKTAYANDATVYETFPGPLAGGGAHSTDLDIYITAADGSDGLKGPNAWAWSDTTDDCSLTSQTAVSAGCAGPVGADEEVMPSNPGTGAFDFPLATFTPAGPQTCPDPPGCTWDSATANSWQTNRRQNATQAFFYVNNFHDHLAAAPIGFNAASHNFENGGPGGNDPVLVNSDDGADSGATATPPTPGLPDDDHVDNANFATPQDGVTPVMQMYLFRDSAFNSVNGGDDAIIVYHEYTHGLSTRLVGGGTADGLDAFQSGAMGEAWSDWYAFDFLVKQFNLSDDPNVNGELNADAYVTPGSDHLIRTEPIDCPVGSAGPECPGTPTAGAGGYTFGDMGKIIGDREVHADGEIWGQTLWDIRNALGSDETEELVTDALRNSPINPGFLDERDQILADAATKFPTDVGTLWSIFAARGMGASASSTSSDGIGVTEAFDTPAVVLPNGVTVDDSAPGGDGDGHAEPGEVVKLTTSLRNPGPGAVTGLSGTLSSGLATIGTATSAFTPASVSGTSSATNSTPFTAAIPVDATCGGAVPLSVATTSTQGSATSSFSLPLGGLGTPVSTVKDNGSLGQTITDNSPAGVDSTLTLSDPGAVGDVNVKIDSLTHTFISDLSVELVSPSGKTVKLVDVPGGEGNNGNNFTNTVFDDRRRAGSSASCPTPRRTSRRTRRRSSRSSR